MKRLAIAIVLVGTLAGCCHNWCCGPSAPAPTSYYGQPPCPTGCVPAAPCTPAVTYSQPPTACVQPQAVYAQPQAAYVQPQARPALPPVQVRP